MQKCEVGRGESVAGLLVSGDHGSLDIGIAAKETGEVGVDSSGPEGVVAGVARVGVATGLLLALPGIPPLA